MEALQVFDFEERPVRVVEGPDGEPWFVGVDVCRCLEIGNPTQAFSRLDEDERSTLTNNEGRPGFGAQEFNIISEPGVYRLVFTSRKAEAERFKRWLAHDVLPALRKTGRYAIPDAEAGPPLPPPPPPGLIDGQPIDAIDCKLRVVKCTRSLYGQAAARRHYAALGIPFAAAAIGGEGTDTAGACDDAEQSGRDCLTLLLDHELVAGRTVRDALDGGDEVLARRAARFGVRRIGGAIAVAKVSAGLYRLYAETPWANGWTDALRGLPGATPGGPTRFGASHCRCTLVPIGLATMPAPEA